MKILGVDEAGRGPVIGPLIIAGVMLPKEKIKTLERLQVKDSKKLTPKKRTYLAKKIKKISKYYITRINAPTIDKLRATGINLNEIEKKAIADIIKKSQPDYAIIDSVDIKPKRFEKEIRKLIKNKNIIIKAEHKADTKYPIVSAASIIAKTQREKEIEKIKKEYKVEFGSGYPNDPLTKKFLSTLKTDKLPDFIRKSWATIKKMQT
ncbi:MAG TPA: ribonuclease HII [Methanothermobacter sp.]|mgnify:CR=1 FL=1|nr:ribonuclease HII [Methanothermobacter sp. MT-2]HHW05432.1 ribonuclease HII [Methanothermobacter sp.]HOK73187.1 ribonuclease HII [Methanothermobacter sp.]HOL68819.1 ribonuclease HII [Methanothermobacter sp.]HPQ04712.1 ribonuclease HII [Methanothermobacter sp.]